jgi:iron complex outermembrane receptor protein
MKAKKIIFILLFLFVLNKAGAEESETPENSLDLSPEEFFNRDLSVFSPAKKLQKLRNVASAIYVMTAEDIRRSGAVNIIDVFRLVPGIEVARVSAHEWAITARGFNQVFGNKIQMLIDGAPTESPTFNGILWENINIPLDVIDRIEFVRGPGAAIWGTRAMNGIINVITKDSFTYPHNSVSAGVGNEQLASGYARTGAVISEKAAIQTYAKIDKYDGSETPDGKRLDDNWEILTGNIRADLKPTDNDKIRLNLGGSSRQADFQLNVPTLMEPFKEERNDQRENHRATAGASWDHDLGDDSMMSMEWTNIFEKRKDFLLDLNAYYSELEMRHRFHPSESHDLTYGANFRFYTDSTNGSDTLSFDPASDALQYYRAFIHDDITLIPDFMTFTLGSRFEQNEQVGFNVLPNARLLISPNDRLSFWGAVSYTVGNPARVYDDVRLNLTAFPEPQTGLPAIVQALGNDNLKSEKLTAYELGIWAEPVKQVYISLTGFYSRYNDVANNVAKDPIPVLDNPTTGPYLLIPLPYTNELRAESIGAELTVDWKTTDWLTLESSYSHLQFTSGPDSSQDRDIVRNYPKQSASFRAHFTISPTIEFDTIARYVDRLPRFQIPSYWEGDVRFSWHVRQNLELEIFGRNLFHNSHQEFGQYVFDTPASDVQRSVFSRINYTF